MGTAPDTFLGAGIQTCVRLINEGAIGMPVAATAFMTCHGHEGWHPDPAFYYRQGGGPVFDMGPYYFTALAALLGPAQRVSGSVKRTFPFRTIGSGPKEGETIGVEVPTHAAGTIDFAIGAVATFVMSFDVWHAELPRIEIYGSDGTLSVPDPNTFGGPVRIRGATDTEWQDVPVPSRYREELAGAGALGDGGCHQGRAAAPGIRRAGDARPGDHARGARRVRRRQVHHPAVPGGQARGASRRHVDCRRVTGYYYTTEGQGGLSMQWFRRGKEEDPEEFWRQTAAKRGGEIGFLTFATLLGRSGDQPLDLPGLLYMVGDMVWFEDFERDNWLARIMGGRRKFEKTEISFSRQEVAAARLVTRTAATRCITGAVPAEKLPAASTLGRILSNPIVLVTIAGGSSLFFDMIRRTEFVALFDVTAKSPPPRR